MVRMPIEDFPSQEKPKPIKPPLIRKPQPEETNHGRRLDHDRVSHIVGA